jgi:hypothetical protein
LQVWGCGGLYELNYRGSLALVNREDKASGACADGAYIDGAYIDGAYADRACASIAYYCYNY